MQTREEKRQKKNIIEVYLSENYTFDITDSSNYLVPFDSIMVQRGNKITLNSDGSITIGAGISYIKAYGEMTFTGTTSGDNTRLFISKKGDSNYTDKYQHIFYEKESISLEPCIIPVSEGSVIRMYLANYANNSMTTYSQHGATYMCIEEV